MQRSNLSSAHFSPKVTVGLPSSFHFFRIPISIMTSTLVSTGIQARRSGSTTTLTKNILNHFLVIMVVKNSLQANLVKSVWRERKKVIGSKIHATIVTISFAIQTISVAPPRVQIWRKRDKIMVKPSLLKLVMTVPTTTNAEIRPVHTFVTKVMVSGG